MRFRPLFLCTLAPEPQRRRNVVLSAYLPSATSPSRRARLFIDAIHDAGSESALSRTLLPFAFVSSRPLSLSLSL